MYLGFDLETGGLDPVQSDLLTAFFAILDDDFKIVDELSLKLKPEGRLPIVEARAMETNGIILEKHLNDPDTVTYAEGTKKLTTFIKPHAKKRGRYNTLKPFGYNILTFDIPWAQHYLLNKQTWESMLHYKCLDVMQQVDTLKDHGWLPPTCGNLGSMVDFFGIAKGKAHVARDDILMTIGVYNAMRELMNSKKNGGNTQDLISLLEAE